MKFEETEEKISLHGLGFIQVKLAGRMRLHVWHPSLPRRRCFQYSAIHDHRFGFVSQVIVGTQINVVYRHTPTLKGDYVSYLHEGPRSQYGNRPWTPDVFLDLEEIYTQELGAGEQYTMAPYVYHQTIPGGSGIVATIMTKTMELKRGAHSTCERGISPDVDFDRKQWSDERLWHVVSDVLKHEEA